LGLTGGAGSKEKRELLKKQLGLPSHLGTSAFLDALNLITTKEALVHILNQ
jgi:ribonuclease M5